MKKIALAFVLAAFLGSCASTPKKPGNAQDFGEVGAELVSGPAPQDLQAVDAPADEECYTYEATGSSGEWQACAGGGSGDVTDAGPGCATGACGTDGLATTGSAWWIWEGTTVDANQITVAVPSDPSGNFTFWIPDAASAAGQAVTCSGTDKVSAFNAATGAFTCTTDDTGAAASSITQGDSSATVTDAGTGTFVVTLDAAAEVSVSGTETLFGGNLDLPADAQIEWNNEPILDQDGSGRITFGTKVFYGGGGVGYWALLPTQATATAPSIVAEFDDQDTGLCWPGANIFGVCAGGVDAFRVNTAASGVTRAEVTPGATGVGPRIAAAGETNLDLGLDVAGTGKLNLGGYGTGAKSGTDAYWLAVDSAGNVIEEAAPGGTGDVTDVGDCTGPACFTPASPDASLTFDNATSGTVTLQTVAGALGSAVLSLPAETGTLCSTAAVCSGYEPSGTYSGIGTCTAQFVRALNDGGAPTCEAISDADVPDTITIAHAATATTADTANAGDSAASFWAAGTCEHERGCLEADVSAYGGLVRIAAGVTSAVTTLTELNTALGSSVADGAHTTSASSLTTGTLAAARGGLALDTSASTGVPTVSTGTWSVAPTLSATLGGTGLNTSALTGTCRVTAGTWSCDAGISHLASSTSAALAGVLSDETGSGGGFMRATGPTMSDAVVTGSLTIPNGTAPTVNAAGKIAHDTTAGQLIYGNTPRVLHPSICESAVIESLAAADDNLSLGMKNFARTITAVGVHCDGTCSTPADIDLSDRSGNTMTHGAPTVSTTTGNTTFTDVTAANGLVSGEGLEFSVANAVSPETDTYTITVCFTVDRQ